MTNKTFIFNKEMAQLLRKHQKPAGLRQKELAKDFGWKKVYISYLENSKIKNPSLDTIFLYLTPCHSYWQSFLADLSAIYFKQEPPQLFQDVSENNINLIQQNPKTWPNLGKMSGWN
ncbi:MAG: helix-turn-helix domain-containing protein [candidate division WOR-3 bacterium]|nr:helix-turn-helix domain-containing protein [candidate division WOR-3 bacterium]